jgi:hypothetical protein
MAGKDGVEALVRGPKTGASTAFEDDRTGGRFSATRKNGKDSRRCPTSRLSRRDVVGTQIDAFSAPTGLFVVVVCF